MRRTKAIVISALISSVVATGIFNVWAFEISEFNAAVRTAVTSGGAEQTAFTADGIPVQTNPRISEKFTSPFYVVHFGLIYSEECRSRVDATDYHWIPDTTSPYWPQPPQSSIELFQYSANWVLENISNDRHGNAHLMYNFDWPYENYPNGMLQAPWSSGLTDAHAITLLLRASDCFGGSAYLEAAGKLYKSVLTPVQDGGSLNDVGGHPWIEEYIDPRVQATSMSHVFNGMAYAYFGIRAYEESRNVNGIANSLKESIVLSIHSYDRGYWSYYDSVGSPANIKYHRINLALLEDPRLQSPEFDPYIRRWSVGRNNPGLFYVVAGPNSIAKWHFLVLFFAFIALGTLLGVAVAEFRSRVGFRWHEA
jgi:hypothetical protein